MQRNPNPSGASQKTVRANETRSEPARAPAHGWRSDARRESAAVAEAGRPDLESRTVDHGANGGQETEAALARAGGARGGAEGAGTGAETARTEEQ